MSSASCFSASRVILLTFALLGASLVSAAAANISVPFIQQKTSIECGRAVLASLAARRGGNVEAQYSRLPPPPDQQQGYSVAEMRRFGAKVGVSLSVMAPRGLVIAGECSSRPPVTEHYRRLAQTVAGGSPVVVPITQRFGGGHYLILVGAKGETFTAHDPGSPGLKQYTASELAARMCDYGYVALRAR
jgi:ABC-type bacteriocin/lantibiotic exporter with double-glycine peptidase domain